jgi:nitrous oxidase accessory protein NosD
MLDLEFNIINGDTGISTSLWSHESLIKNNRIIGRSTGIYLDGTHHVVNNNIINGKIGINLRGREITIENNVIESSETGVLIVSHNNMIIRNKILSTGHAIDLSGDRNNVISNVLTGGRGVHANGAYGNIIIYNLINMTGSVGVYLSKYTGDNLIYGNTFWYCYNYEAADESGRNQWYLENTTHKIGNYWSYNKEPDKDGDGIIDTPYHIPTTTGIEIVDKYPLAKPLTSPYQQPSTTYTSTTTHTMTSIISTSTSLINISVLTSQEIYKTDYQYIFISAVIIMIMIVIGFILLRHRKQ